MVRIVFCGTSLFAVPSFLRLLESGMNIVGVVTQPDRPQGRSRKIAACPVKESASSRGVPVFQPDKIKSADSISFIKSWEPELIVVVSYGQILPVELLEYPTYGCINVHASLLPEYRGAAPIQRALMDGKKLTGISIMFMNEGLDTGDVILQAPVAISDNICHGELEALMADIGAELLLEAIFRIEKGSVCRKKQDHEKATYAHMISPADEKIDWQQSALSIHNQIRALDPKPGAHTIMEGRKLKLYKSQLADINGKANQRPGEVVYITDKSFGVQTGEGVLEILEVQKEGKKRMTASDFLRGIKLCTGVILGRG